MGYRLKRPLLTDTKIRSTEAAAKRQKLYDLGGLYLCIEPNGSKLWRMRYKFAGKHKLLSFGPYPKVTLAAARAARDSARAELLIGYDPSRTRKEKRIVAKEPENGFEEMARAWHERNRPSWQSTKHAADVLLSLERHIFPTLGKLPIREITAPMVLNTLLDVEKGRPGKGQRAETAHRLRQRISAIFQYAIARGKADVDQAASIGKELATVEKKPQPAFTTIEQLHEMLATVESKPAHAVTKLAHRLLAITSVRSNELLGARWDEFEDLDGSAPVWKIPPERMKMKKPHVVPLSRQALEVIEAVRVASGTLPILFPNTRWAHRPMSNNAIGFMLNRAGYKGEHVPHGWRAAFSTLMNEAYPADRPTIDMMLAHENKNAIEAAYNRAQHLERRRFLAQTWADMLMVNAVPAVDLLRGPAR